MTNRTNNRWKPEEDEVLLRYVKANPQNLHRCFFLVAEHLSDEGHQRTPTAVQAHWYSVLSRKEESLCFFTASAHHVSKNRKNGAGVQTSPSIWHRFLRVLRLVN